MGLFQTFQIKKSMGVLVLSVLWVQPVQAETLDLDTLTQRALAQSLALQIAAVDTRIGKAGEQIARADYFPTIKGSFNTERLHSLQGQFQPVQAVNNTVLPYGTRYQNSVGLSVQYTVLDFGLRQRKLRMAQAETKAKGAVYFQTLRDLRLKMVDLYAEALTTYRLLRAHEALLILARQNYQYKKRLYAAGSQSKVDVAEEAIQVAQAMDAIQTDEGQLSEQLQSISAYTQQPYAAKTSELADLQEDGSVTPPAFQSALSPEARQYDQLILQKQAEIELYRRQYLPQLTVYSNYNLYGTDPDHWLASVRNLAQRTISVGVNVSLPIFDGFKTRGQVEKAQLEQEKLKLQRQEKLWQLEQQAQLYQTQVAGKLVQLHTKATVVNSTQDKLSLVNRLSDNQVVDRTQPIKEQMVRIQKQVEAEKVLIQQLAALKKLQILAEG